LCLVALFLSGSTSAWAGGVLAVGSIFWVAVCVGSIKLRNGLIQFVVLGILGLGAGTYIVGSTVPDADLVRLIQDRSVARIQSEGILGDPAEQAALNVLRSNPMLLAFGSGLGGMSFYIKELGVLHSEFVLEPNTGVLRWVGSFGLVGLVVLGLSVARGASVLRSAVSCGGPDSVITLAVVGLAVVGQCLVFGTSFLWSVGLGSLAAAEASWFRYWAGTATASMGHSHRSLGLTDPSAPKQCEY